MPDEQNSESTKAVPVASCTTELEASMIATGLNERGIEARVVGGATAGFRAEAPGMVKVLVHADDLAEAQCVIKEIRDEAKEIDWSEVDLGELED